jgi:excisionase family DNA binding protein
MASLQNYSHETKMPPIAPPKQYTVKEAAKYLKLCTDAVYDLAANCQLKSRRKGPRKGRIYFLQQDLDDYLFAEPFKNKKP